MSDDHAAHAISAYGGRINATPNLDRIAAAGRRLANSPPEPGPQGRELSDLQADPHERRSVYGDPAYRDVVRELEGELRRLRDELGDTTDPWA